MTALTALAVPDGLQDDSSLRPLRWRRMVWVTWRQHRAALYGVAALLGALAVYLLVAGLQLHHAYSAAVGCHPARSDACGYLVGVFIHRGSFFKSGVALQVVPALIGIFVGAPVLGRELETGTVRFAWTQGFGPWRWALAKLVGLALAVAAAGGAMSLLFSWYYEPYLATGQRLSTTFPLALSPGLFDLRGVVFAAWTLAAFAIGCFAGMLLRRVVPAIVAALGLYTGLALATVGLLRPNYLAPVVTRSLNVPDSAWVLHQQWVTKGGNPVGVSVLGRLLQNGAPQLAGKGGVPQSLSTWQYLTQHGYTQWTTYQPAGRFWPFQWIEGAWLVGLSLLLIAATVWLVRRRAV